MRKTAKYNLEFRGKFHEREKHDRENVAGFQKYRQIFPVDVFFVRNKPAIIFPSKVY